MPDEPGTADELLNEMNLNGVDFSVLVQTSWSTWNNGYIADSVERFPDRFVGHGLIDPLDKNNAEKAVYWMQDRGLVGFRFHPMYYPEEDVLLNESNGPLWEELSRKEAIVQFHMRAGDAVQIDVLAKRFAHMNFLVDHMGYPDTSKEFELFTPVLDLAKYDNVFVKISDVAGRSNDMFPHIDVHPYIRLLYDAFGSSRLLWGTGYPGHHRKKNNWHTLADELRLIREGIPFLSELDVEQILGKTAKNIWGI
tara:strand:- start:354 stop:1109 length:756 start_codon:yes stop_codon:yes gene_type:complete